MQKKSFLFLINYYNDIDHTAPLMHELLKRGHIVSIICLTTYDLESDVRVNELNSLSNFNIHKFFLLPRNTGISNQKTGSISLAKKIFRELLFSVLTTTIFLWWRKYQMTVFTWGRPRAKGLQRRIFQAAKFLGIPTICVPHGQNIYINYDVNHLLRINYEKNLQWPDFSERNEFTRYIVQSQRHRQQHIDWGMSQDKVLALGSLRFDPKWVERNFSYYPDQELWAGNYQQDPLRIVFFLPHWRYNVDIPATYRLIRDILDQKNTLMIIKGHTRGDKVELDMASQLEKLSNVMINSSHESPQLSRWADIVVNFGSSIALESIILGKFVIYPSFLHSNTTIFDNHRAVYHTENTKQTLDLIRNIQQRKENLRDQTHTDALLETEVYANESPHEVANNYASLLLEMVK